MKLKGEEGSSSALGSVLGRKLGNRCGFRMSFSGVLVPITAGVAELRVSGNEALIFGRDHIGSQTIFGITSQQISREQGRLKRGLAGSLELMNRGLGMMRVVRPPANAQNVPCMRPSETKRLYDGDQVQLLQVLRTCPCSLRHRCSCFGGEGDQIGVVAEWRVAIRGLCSSSFAAIDTAPVAGAASAASKDNFQRDNHIAPGNELRAAPSALLPPAAAVPPALAAPQTAPLEPQRSSAPPAPLATPAPPAPPAPQKLSAPAAAVALTMPAPPAPPAPKLPALPEESAPRPLPVPVPPSVPLTPYVLSRADMICGSLGDAEQAMTDLRKALHAHPLEKATREKLETLASSLVAAAAAAKQAQLVLACNNDRTAATQAKMQCAQANESQSALGRSSSAVQKSAPRADTWDACDPVEALRVACSEFHAAEGWIQCDRCHKWRPPLEPNPADKQGGGDSQDSEDSAVCKSDVYEDEKYAVVGAVTGVVEDGVPWQCSQHPDPRFASCDALVVHQHIGERYQATWVPELGMASSPSTDRHAQLTPMTLDELHRQIPNRSALNRKKGGRRAGRGKSRQGGRRSADLPEGDSQRWDYEPEPNEIEVEYDDDSDDGDGRDLDDEEDEEVAAVDCARGELHAPPAELYRPRSRGRPSSAASASGGRSSSSAASRRSSPIMPVGRRVSVTAGTHAGSVGIIRAARHAWLNVLLEDGSDVSVRKMNLELLQEHDKIGATSPSLEDVAAAESPPVARGAQVLGGCWPPSGPVQPGESDEDEGESSEEVIRPAKKRRYSPALSISS